MTAMAYQNRVSNPILLPFHSEHRTCLTFEQDNDTQHVVILTRAVLIEI